MKNKICLTIGLLLMSATINLYAQQPSEQSYNVNIINNTDQTIQITEGTVSSPCVTIDNLSPSQDPYPITVDQSGFNIPFSLKADTLPNCKKFNLMTFTFNTMDNRLACLPYIELRWDPKNNVTGIGMQGTTDYPPYNCQMDFSNNTLSIAVNRN